MDDFEKLLCREKTLLNSGFSCFFTDKTRSCHLIFTNRKHFQQINIFDLDLQAILKFINVPKSEVKGKSDSPFDLVWASP